MKWIIISYSKLTLGLASLRLPFKIYKVHTNEATADSVYFRQTTDCVICSVYCEKHGVGVLVQLFWRNEGRVLYFCHPQSCILLGANCCTFRNSPVTKLQQKSVTKVQTVTHAVT